MKVLSKLKKRRGIIDFVWLAMGSILGQGMAIVFAPILSRIYTEEQIGTYTLILTVVGMFESAICLRYDLIIVSEKSDDSIRNLTVSCFRISVILSATITVIYSLYLVLSKQLSLSKVWLSAFVFPILLCSGIVLILTAINNRNKNYKFISISSLSQGFVHNGLSALLGCFRVFGVLGLIVGRLLGYISYIFVSVRTDSVKRIIREKSSTKANRLSLLKKHKKQALFSTPAVIVSCVSYSIINLFISRLYGTAILGVYSYSYRLLGLPLTVISANISRMFFKDASIEYNTTNTMKKSFVKILIPISIISLVMVVAFKLFAPFVFGTFLGEKWREAGVYVQILAPMYGIRLISNSFANATIVTGKQIVSLLIQLSYLLAASIIYLVCSINNYDVYTFLRVMNYMFCVIYSIYFLSLAIICIRKGSKSND